MKIKLAFLTVLLSSSAVFGQQFEKLLHSKKNSPTYIVNKNTIVGSDFTDYISAEGIKSMDVINPKQTLTDEHVKDFPNLSQYGLIIIEVSDFKMATKTQSEIRSFFGADANTKIYVDGYLLKKADYKIAVKSIKEIEIVKPNEQDLNDEKIINIWTLDKQNRLGNLKLERSKLQGEKGRN